MHKRDENSAQNSSTHSLPAGHALDLAALVGRWNVSIQALFAGLGVSIEALHEPAHSGWS